MDTLHHSSFTPYIRNPRNANTTSLHLSLLLKHQSPHRIAPALRWLTQSWPIEPTARLFRRCFFDWLPELAALVLVDVMSGWDVRPVKELCLAFLFVGEGAGVVGRFLGVCCGRGWSVGETVGIVMYLAGALEWDANFLEDVGAEIVRTFEGIRAGADNEKVQQLREELKILTRPVGIRTAIDNRLAIATYRLAVAQYNLDVVSHYASCDECHEREPCPVAMCFRPPRVPGVLRDAPPELFAGMVLNISELHQIGPGRGVEEGGEDVVDGEGTGESDGPAEHVDDVEGIEKAKSTDVRSHRASTTSHPEPETTPTLEPTTKSPVPSTSTPAPPHLPPTILQTLPKPLSRHSSTLSIDIWDLERAVEDRPLDGDADPWSSSPYIEVLPFVDLDEIDGVGGDDVGEEDGEVELWRRIPSTEELVV
ncbi:hypothetical protein HDV00_010503 [Rhizophlyctis rosea]|nr:hypothetical protein HDV00_010503 [Rhizophlyctis rosea]